MKRFYIFFLLCNFIYIDSSSSQHLVATNRKWTVPDDWGFLDRYFFNGDTTLGNETYKKLYSASDSTYAISYYRGAMREDSTGKVYLDNGNLLYDFSLNVGD